MLLTTVLSNRSSHPDQFQVNFFADRGNIDKITLRVMKHIGGGSDGNALRVRDFVELK